MWTKRTVFAEKGVRERIIYKNYYLTSTPGMLNGYQFFKMLGEQEKEQSRKFSAAESQRRKRIQRMLVSNYNARINRFMNDVTIAAKFCSRWCATRSWYMTEESRTARKRSTPKRVRSGRTTGQR